MKSAALDLLREALEAERQAREALSRARKSIAEALQRIREERIPMTTAALHTGEAVTVADRIRIAAALRQRAARMKPR